MAIVGAGPDGVNQTADRWGILGVALEANTGGTGAIPVIVKVE